MMKEWNPEEMRRKFSREELIGHLQREYCMNLPWELDDALDYAQSVYPDITEKDLKNRQQTSKNQSNDSIGTEIHGECARRTP